MIHDGQMAWNARQWYKLTAPNVCPTSDMSESRNRIPCLAIAVAALVFLCWFALACGGGEPEASDAPNYEATVAAALEKANVSEPTAEPTVTAEPTPAPTPTEIPPSPAPTVSSAIAPPRLVSGDMGPLAPLPIDDPSVFLTDLSDGERSCLSAAVAPERLAAVLEAPESADEAERSALLSCLEHDTLLRLFLTGVLSATGPLSPESSECLRSSYADTDLSALLSAVASQGDPGGPGESAQMAGMVSFMVSLSCLSEEEFQVAAPAMGIAPGEYEGFQCVLEKVGGQDAMTALLTPAGEFPVALLQAAAECQLQLAGPPPG